MCAILCAAADLGCATRRLPVPSSPGVSSRETAARSNRSLRLAWLPVEGFAYPQVAVALNDRLESARIANVDHHFRAPVSMEVAQLSLECIEAQPRCYEVVGKHLRANRLLWAELSLPNKGGRALRATVLLFDVDRLVQVHRAEREFSGPDAAVAGFSSMVEETVAASAALDGAAAAALAAP
jgi:hypothetical protein